MSMLVSLFALAAALSASGDGIPPALTERAVSRSMDPGTVHRYEVSLEQGEFIRLVVKQQGIDVIVRVTAPDGVLVADHDSAYGRYGPEVVALLAERTGVYRIELSSREQDAIPGRYEIRIEERRRALRDDPIRIAAQKAFEEACNYDRAATAESRSKGLRKSAEALELWRKLGDSAEEAMTLIEIGDLNRDLSEHRVAIQSYERALNLLRALGDRRGEARALRKAGTLMRVVGEPQRALEMLRNAALIAREVGDPQIECSTMRSLGWAWMSVGEYQKALESAERSLTIARAIRDRGYESSALDEIAKTYDYLGDHQKAIEYSLQAVELARSRESASHTMLAVRGLGLMYFRAGRLDKATAGFRESVEIARSLGDRRRQAFGETNLGDVDLEAGDTTAALEDFGSALQLAEAVNFPGAVGAALNGLGRAHAKREDPEQALSFFNRALVVFRRIKDRDGEQHTLAEIARLELGRGRLSESRTAIDAAVAVVESMSARFRNPEVRLYYTASTQPLYAFDVDLLARLHERDPSVGFDRRAFEISERGRARALLEALATAAVEPKASEPLMLAPVQQIIPVKTCLVAYTLTETGIVVFLVSRDAFHAQRLATPARDLADRIQNYVDLLSKGDAGAADMGRSLYGDLVEPWRGFLPSGTRRLVLLPDGPLHELPFESLSTAGPKRRFLLEDFGISYAPSASVLGRLAAPRSRDRAPHPDVLIVAEPERARSGSAAWKVYEDEGFKDTPIPFSRLEAERISRYTSPSRVLLMGAEARKTRVTAPGLDRFRVLHFATHAFASRRFPALSALALAADATSPGAGFLSAAEIYRLRLDSDLVVLSGCQTARGKILGGEVQGLVRAFLHAGARSVVASLWNVNDEATAALMESFYRGLARGLGKADALREARLELFRKGAAPRLWAPFVLIGEADESVPLL